MRLATTPDVSLLLRVKVRLLPGSNLVPTKRVKVSVLHTHFRRRQMPERLTAAQRFTPHHTSTQAPLSLVTNPHVPLTTAAVSSLGPTNQPAPRPIHPRSLTLHPARRPRLVVHPVLPPPPLPSVPHPRLSRSRGAGEILATNPGKYGPSPRSIPAPICSASSSSG